MTVVNVALNIAISLAVLVVMLAVLEIAARKGYFPVQRVADIFLPPPMQAAVLPAMPVAAPVTTSGSAA